jgi:hypothetical protein
MLAWATITRNTGVSQFVLKRAAAKKEHNRTKHDEEVIEEFEKLIKASERTDEIEGNPKGLAAGELVEGLKAATLNRLMKELDVEQRFDAMIDRLIKRLLFVRGLKSIASSEVMPPSSSARTSLPRI